MSEIQTCPNCHVTFTTVEFGLETVTVLATPDGSSPVIRVQDRDRVVHEFQVPEENGQTENLPLDNTKGTENG